MRYNVYLQTITYVRKFFTNHEKNCTKNVHIIFLHLAPHTRSRLLSIVKMSFEAHIVYKLSKGGNSHAITFLYSFSNFARDLLLTIRPSISIEIFICNKK